MSTFKAIADYGLAVVLAGCFIYYAYQTWRENKSYRESQLKLTLGFLDTANKFNQTATNFDKTMADYATVEGNEKAHMTAALEDFTKSNRELAEMVSKICEQLK